jgi:hypothetical protein
MWDKPGASLLVGRHCGALHDRRISAFTDDVGQTTDTRWGARDPDDRRVMHTPKACGGEFMDSFV